jgi:hypothetical protein
MLVADVEADVVALGDVPTVLAYRLLVMSSSTHDQLTPVPCCAQRTAAAPGDPWTATDRCLERGNRLATVDRLLREAPFTASKKSPTT